MSNIRYVAAFGLFVASQAVAETAAPTEGPAPLSRTFPCGAFVKNSDGIWSATHDVNIVLPNGGEVMTIGPAVSFRPGVTTHGADLAALLEQQCPGR
jgi:hypothetical protein